MRLRSAFLVLALVSLYSVIVVGAYVTVAGFGDACGSSVPQDWPTCLGGLLPPAQLGPIAEYTHRIFAALSTLFLFVATALFWRAKDAPRQAKRTLVLASVLLVIQVLLGGVVIAQEEEAVLVAAHQGLAILTFGVAVAAFVMSRRPREGF